MGDKIVNYNALGTRRIELQLPVGSGQDAFELRSKVQALLAADRRVLPEPSPEIEISGSSRTDAKLVIRSWLNATDYNDVSAHLQEELLSIALKS